MNTDKHKNSLKITKSIPISNFSLVWNQLSKPTAFLSPLFFGGLSIQARFVLFIAVQHMSGPCCNYMFFLFSVDSISTTCPCPTLVERWWLYHWFFHFPWIWHIKHCCPCLESEWNFKKKTHDIKLCVLAVLGSRVQVQYMPIWWTRFRQIPRLRRRHKNQEKQDGETEHPWISIQTYFVSHKNHCHYLFGMLNRSVKWDASASYKGGLKDN
jgi:hypothetical protein